MEDSSSPHGQLVKAYAALKKEKEALTALAALYKKETEDLRCELQSTETLLASETNRAKELEDKLELKSISIDCQLAEAESFSNDKLEEAFRENQVLKNKIADLEFYIEESKKEKENLLMRTASLARRDQLQKASIATSNLEISRLTKIVEEFQERFSSLAIMASETKDSLGAGNDEREAEGENKRTSDAGSQQGLAAWETERKELCEKIRNLESLCEELQTNEIETKSKFTEILSKHQSRWQEERKKLKEEISDLIAEKDAIETQVAEIAELLEKDSLARHGSTYSLESISGPEMDNQ